MGVDKVKPAFGSHEEELEILVERGIIPFNPTSFDSIFRQIGELSRTIETSPTQRKATVLFHGSPGSGTTAMAARLAMDSGYSFIRVITPKSLLRFKSEMAKRDHVTQIFSDAERSKKSLIVLDKLEYLIDWIPLGNAYSPILVSAIRTALQSDVPVDRHQLVFVTTTNYSLVKMFELHNIFDRKVFVPPVMDLTELTRILAAKGGSYKGNEDWTCKQIQAKTGSPTVRLGIKRLLGTLEICRVSSQGDARVEVEGFIESVSEDIISENS